MNNREYLIMSCTQPRQINKRIQKLNVDKIVISWYHLDLIIN